jgi:arsenate reductase (glutaredoxin)
MPDTPSSQAHITIYHNPKCGTSRNVLAMIQNSGEEPNVVEYLKTPLNAEQLQALVHKLGIPVRDLLRQKGTPYDELGLGEAHWTDEQLIEQMATHPILMNRPVVVTPLGAKLCRPSEAVLDILPNAQQGGFTKEDGEVVVPGKQPNA